MSKKKDPAWAEAKKKCRLNEADVQMAKELGMKPKSLLKNIPSPKENWKEPVKYWVRNLYEEKFGFVKKPEKQKTEPSRKGKEKRNNQQSEEDIIDRDLPF